MRKTLLAGLILTLLATGTAVGQSKLTVQYDKTYDFSFIKTFTLQLATSWGNPLGEKMVQQHVEKALAAKGWSKVDGPEPDVTVIVHGATQDKRRLNAMYSGGGWRFGGMGSGTIQEQDYSVGTLVVDIYNTNTKELLYRGVAQGELSDKPEKNEKKVAKAVAKLFKDFPPATKKP